MENTVLRQILQKKQNERSAYTSIGHCHHPIVLSCTQYVSKVLDILGQPAQEQSVNIGNENLENVERFTYLGSVMDRQGEVETDVNNRIWKVAAAFRRQNEWRSTASAWI